MATQPDIISESRIGAQRLLVVSPRPRNLHSLWTVAKQRALHCVSVSSGWEALAQLRSSERLDLLVLDLTDGGSDEMHALRWLREVRPDLAIFLLASVRNDAQQAEALNLGARAYLVSPSAAELEHAILGNTADGETHSSKTLNARIERISGDGFFVFAAPSMQKLRVHAELLAQMDVPVLISGEPGSGKESTARLIHQLSKYSDGQFCRVDCSALSEAQLREEIFGSSSNADDLPVRPGRLETCDGGVVYIANSSMMPLAIQVHLMQVIQEKAYLTASGTRAPLCTRIIVATESQPEEAVAVGRLHAELYYRLSAFSICVPAIRQRRDGIPALLEHFMDQIGEQYGLKRRPLSAALLRACQVYAWPGNVSELRDFAKRYLVVGDEELAIWELKRNTSNRAGDSSGKSGRLHFLEAETGNGNGNRAHGLKSLVQNVRSEAEKSAIADALQETHWNRKAASRMLGVSYRTLLYKIQLYAMVPPRYFPSLLPANGSKRDGRTDQNE